MRNQAIRLERPGIQVIDRAVALLTVLADEPRGVSLGELAARTELPKPTTRRVLAALERHRLCERRAVGTYELGLGVLELGLRLYHRLDVRVRARPALEALRDDTGLTVYLCIPRDDHAVCIDLLLGKFEHTFGLRLGGTLPLHVGAAGKAALAWDAEPAIEQYLERGPLARLTPQTAVDPEVIRAELAQARRDGVTVSDGDVIEGAAAIGAPIFDHTGEVIGGLSVSGLRPQILGTERLRLAGAVREAAQVVSASLGAGLELESA